MSVCDCRHTHATTHTHTHTHTHTVRWGRGYVGDTGGLLWRGALFELLFGQTLCTALWVLSLCTEGTHSPVRCVGSRCVEQRRASVCHAGRCCHTVGVCVCVCVCVCVLGLYSPRP